MRVQKSRILGHIGDRVAESFGLKVLDCVNRLLDQRDELGVRSTLSQGRRCCAVEEMNAERSFGGDVARSPMWAKVFWQQEETTLPPHEPPAHPSDRDPHVTFLLCWPELKRLSVRQPQWKDSRGDKFLHHHCPVMALEGFMITSNGRTSLSPKLDLSVDFD